MPTEVVPLAIHVAVDAGTACKQLRGVGVAALRGLHVAEFVEGLRDGRMRCAERGFLDGQRPLQRHRGLAILLLVRASARPSEVR